MSALHRHDLRDDQWLLLKPYLPGSKGNRGRRGNDNRLFINAVLWKLRTGIPWRDLPPDYGHWNTVWKRFQTWRDLGVWDKLFSIVADDPDLEWLMIDASHIKAHPHASGAVRRTGTKASAEQKVA